MYWCVTNIVTLYISYSLSSAWEFLSVKSLVLEHVFLATAGFCLRLHISEKEKEKKERKLCTKLELKGCVILKFCCLLRGQHQPAYCSFGLSCFYEENKITPKGALAARQMGNPYP